MNRVMFVVNQLKIYGEDVKDQAMIEKLLRSLSTKFDVVVAAIEEAKDLEKLTINELMGSLLSHEARIDRNKDSTLETTFQSEVYISRGRGKGRSRSRGRGSNYGGHRDGRDDHEHQHGSSSSRSFHNNQRSGKYKVKCFYCTIDLVIMLVIVGRRLQIKEIIELMLVQRILNPCF